MQKFVLWCTTSADEYPLVGHTLTTSSASPYVSRVFVVVTGKEKPKGFGRYSASDPKFVEFHKNFGDGFDLALEEGGYNQVAARNFALEKVEGADADWAVQIDADEIYEPFIFELLQSVPRDINVVTGSYYTLLSECSHWFEERKFRNTKAGRLYDPHTSIWRTDLGVRYDQSPGVEQNFANISRHCGVMFNRYSNVRMTAITVPYYFHLHCLLNKRHTDKMSQTPRKLGFTLPEKTGGAIRSLRKAGLMPTPFLKDPLT